MLKNLKHLICLALILITFGCNKNEPLLNDGVSVVNLQENKDFIEVSEKIFENKQTIINRLKDLGYNKSLRDKNREEIISLIEKDEVILDAMVDLSYNSINFIQSNKSLSKISTQDAELIFDRAISVRYKDKVSSLRAEDPDEKTLKNLTV